VEGGLAVDGIVAEAGAVFELLPGKQQALLVSRNT
jgi:hypothetical protein